MKTLLITLSLGLALLTASCGSEGEPQGSFQRPPTPVETATVTESSVTDRFATVGTLEASDAITVAAEIDGIVVDVPFEEGSHLEKSAVILRLDDEQLRAEADRARAVLDQRLSTWKRVKTVVAQGAGSPQDLDDATAALKVAEADLALAGTRLAKATVHAPFAGMVGSRQVSPGAFLRAGQAITELARMDMLRVTFSVPERLLGAISMDAQVVVTTTAHPDVALEGTIGIIEPQLDPETRSAGVVARLLNTGGLLRPGMSASVSVILAERQEALTIPSEAVFVEGGQAFVYAVNPDSIVTRSAVQLGSRLTGRVEVQTGLQRGQMVVQAGHQKLYDGAKIMPVEGSDPEGGSQR